ncbi:unnamed protein product [Protopolystoma xenopodis]|uniref:Uncharacterized protein n=1 Tax=Protopolystoma xenopodis TaxID=117903 RepID=A0A3S5AI49_9PLAT|nr:unnamed protein product [Protopolystoma xenopodis]
METIVSMTPIAKTGQSAKRKTALQESRAAINARAAGRNVLLHSFPKAVFISGRGHFVALCDRLFVCAGLFCSKTAIGCTIPAPFYREARSVTYAPRHPQKDGN